MVGVAVNVGGTSGVSVGIGVGVAAGWPPPQALKTTVITTKRIMNLGRTNFLQEYKVPHALGVSDGLAELYTLAMPGRLLLLVKEKDRAPKARGPSLDFSFLNWT